MLHIPTHPTVCTCRCFRALRASPPIRIELLPRGNPRRTLAPSVPGLSPMGGGAHTDQLKNTSIDKPGQTYMGGLHPHPSSCRCRHESLSSFFFPLKEMALELVFGTMEFAGPHPHTPRPGSGSPPPFARSVRACTAVLGDARRTVKRTFKICTSKKASTEGLFRADAHKKVDTNMNYFWAKPIHNKRASDRKKTLEVSSHRASLPHKTTAQLTDSIGLY